MRKTVEKAIENYAKLRALFEKKAERDAGSILKKESMAGDAFRVAVIERANEVHAQTRAEYDAASHKQRAKIMRRIENFNGIGDIKPGETKGGITWAPFSEAESTYQPA